MASKSVVSSADLAASLCPRSASSVADCAATLCSTPAISACKHANQFGDQPPFLGIVPTQHIMAGLDRSGPIVLFVAVGPEFDVPVFGHSEPIDFVELLDRIAAAKIEPPQNFASHPRRKIVARAKLQLPQHRLRMQPIAERGVGTPSCRLASKRGAAPPPFRSPSWSVRHRRGRADISLSGTSRLSENDRSTISIEASQRRSSGTTEINSAAYGNMASARLEILANPAPHRGQLRGKVGLPLRENLQFVLFLAKIAVKNSATNKQFIVLSLHRLECVCRAAS